MWKVNICLLFFNNVLLVLNACGQVTHIEIGYRALYNYSDVHGTVSYDEIARHNQDALEAGNSYPDAFYPSYCFGGKYHGTISEATHWTPFTNVTIHYIRNHYPKPWDRSTEKLVAFLLGVVSHQVADVSWHSLGIDQGFLETMSYTNFHGVYPKAHIAGDLGGDVLNLFQLNLGYSDAVKPWYIPIDDLVTIYTEYYGHQVIDHTAIEICMKMQYLLKLAERFAVEKYFPISAKQSPYLVDELYSYFLGGVEDMAAWTQRIWKYVTGAIEQGTQHCNMDHNPLFIRCNDSLSPMVKRSSTSLKNGFYTKSNFDMSELKNSIRLKREGRGVILKPSDGLTKKLQNLFDRAHNHSMRSQDQKLMERVKVKDDVKKIPPDFVLTVGTKYANLGRAYAVADLDSDGNEDVVIGSPGFYSDSHQQNGMVFILYGTDNGLNMSKTDVYEISDVKIPGPEDKLSAHSQFGSSLAIFDMDKDGKLDIAIGAPSFGSVNLTYTGRVFLYSPVHQRQYALRGSIVCKEVYCNLGSSLSSGDLNSDLYDDLIVGSPFAPGRGAQQGMLGIVHASKKYRGKSDFEIEVSDMSNNLFGSQNYSWFGSSTAAKKFEGETKTYLAVGELNFRKCSKPDCSYNASDTQAVGRITITTVDGLAVGLDRQITGTKEFAMLGTAVDFGRPYDDKSNVLAVTAVGQGVLGHVDHIPVPFPQVGSVYLYNLSNLDQPPTTVFNGDRLFGRFGAQIKFADLNRDGFDDLIIGAPLRTDDITEELKGAQQGRVYIYFGGPNFPRGDATSNCSGLFSVEPCPCLTASHVLEFGEDLARFGSQIAVVKSKNKVNLLITSAHSARGARLSGAIAVFDFS